MKPIELSRHARERARRRGVEASQLSKVLEAPDQVYRDVEHRTKIAVKRTDEKHLILAYTEDTTAIRVITVYYTTKLDRLEEAKTERGAWRRVK